MPFLRQSLYPLYEAVSSAQGITVQAKVENFVNFFVKVFF